MNNDKDKIEFMREAVESTGEPRRGPLGPAAEALPNERKIMAIISLIFSAPFPVAIIFLWMTLGAIEGQGTVFSDATMNAVLVYLLLFFVIPLFSLASVILAFIVTTKASIAAKKMGYISLVVTLIGFIILGIFLNRA